MKKKIVTTLALAALFTFLTSSVLANGSAPMPGDPHPPCSLWDLLTGGPCTPPPSPAPPGGGKGK